MTVDELEKIVYNIDILTLIELKKKYPTTFDTLVDQIDLVEANFEKPKKVGVLLAPRSA